MNTPMFPLELFNALFSDLDRGYLQVQSLLPIYDLSYPPFNLSIDETTKNLQFEFAVAGLSLDDIDISYEDDYLKLDIKSKERNDQYYNWKSIKKGIRTSNSKTAYFVPFAKYDVADSKASILDGILTIFVPIREDAKPKKIEIKNLNDKSDQPKPS
jgi:HSP20 family molecular chaperone IbpA